MKNIRKKLIITAATAALITIAGCGQKQVETAAPAQPETIAAATPAPAIQYAGKVCISEVMPKNKATVQDMNGEFTDWIEIENVSDESISLNGWIADTGKDSAKLDGTTLEPGQIVLVFMTVDNGGEVKLVDENNITVDTWNVPDIESDRSVVKNEDGQIVECMYPTPGLTNTGYNFDYLQESKTPAGSLEIYEVCVEDYTYKDWDVLGHCDWVEIKNISNESICTQDWYLTDDLKEPYKYNLGNHTLDPGETCIIPCDSDASEEQIRLSRFATFSLDSGNERLYLISPEGNLSDYTPLKDIPAGMTYGRVDDENGFFYLSPTPEHYNSESQQRARRVCESPVAVSEDGVFNDVSKVEVSLSSTHDIYYTLDGSTPTKESEKYNGPFSVKETTIVKAVAVEDGTINSRPLVLSYIINENNTLPVVSVVADNYKEFEQVYDNGYKYTESPGTISYYGPDGKFTMGAGIKLHGYSTLNYRKKNLSFKFRGCYGSDELNFDLFGDGAEGGVTKFSDLLLRAGGDQKDTIVKNEVFLELAKEFSDKIYYSRYKYVAVYKDGEYVGIYALMDKNNEQWFANKTGVTKDSVYLTEDPAYSSNMFYEDVLNLVFFEDASDPEVYEKICKVLDVDSLIDWTIIEGFSANWDLESGNLKYAKSDELDGKWKYIMYDLDNALSNGDSAFCYVLNYHNQVSALNGMLLKNEVYRQKFLERASYALQNVLTVENLWKHYEELTAVIDEEAKLDQTMSYESWQGHLENLKDTLFEDWNWYKCCVDEIGYVTGMSQEEKMAYFGDVDAREVNTDDTEEN